MQSNNIDEFGRDLSLRPKQYKSIFGDILDRFKGMSWAEMSYMEEEEEEERKRKEDEVKRKEDEKKKLVEREQFRKELAARKKLVQQGLYELEEGEVLDL